MSDFPRENLLRASYPAVELRAADDGMPTMVGHFARFNEWTKIDSAYEGTFMERVAPGAFRKTLTENRERIRVLFQHGRDPQIGDKPLGPITDVREDDDGAWYEVSLLDTSYNRDLLPGLQAGLYGASFRFTVVKEDVDRNAKRSTHNPDGLPERTIREARVMEFGPVTFPAYAGATAGVRSITLSDLDAALAPPESPALPADGAAPEAHSDEGSREAETPVAPTQENVTVEYVTLDEKRARVRELNDEIKRMAEVPGVLPAAERADFDGKVEERKELEAAIADQEYRLSLVREQAKREDSVEPTYSAPAVIRSVTETDIYDLDSIPRRSRSIEHRDQLYRDNAMRAVEQMRPAHPLANPDAVRGNIAYLIDHKDSQDKELARRILATGSPQYRREFERYIRSNGELRGTALAVGVDGTGGYAVPFQLDPTIVHTGAWTTVNPYRASCRVETIVGTDTWQAITANAITAAYALEAAAATEQGPTFTQPAYVAKRAHAAVTASYEILSDRSDLAAELAVLIGEAKDTLEENQFTVGAGTTVYPQGIGLKDAFTRVDSVTNDTTAVADVLAVEAGLPIRHRMNAAWYLTRAAIRAIQAWETTGGQLFSGVGYPAVGNPVNRSTGNTGLTLLGYPIWETPSMPWTPTTDDTTWGVLMDPRNYVIVDRAGLSVKVIPDAFDATTGFPTGQSFIYAFWRNTARVLNADGGRQGAVQ